MRTLGLGPIERFISSSLLVLCMGICMGIFAVGCTNSDWTYRWAPDETLVYRTDFSVQGVIRAPFWVQRLEGRISGSTEARTVTVDRDGARVSLSWERRVQLQDPGGEFDEWDRRWASSAVVRVSPQGRIERLEEGAPPSNPPDVLALTGWDDRTAWIGPPLPESPPSPGETWSHVLTWEPTRGLPVTFDVVHAFLGYGDLNGDGGEPQTGNHGRYAIIRSRLQGPLPLAGLLGGVETMAPGELEQWLQGEGSLTSETTSYVDRRTWRLQHTDQRSVLRVELQGREPLTRLPLEVEAELEFEGGLERLTR